MRLIPTLFLLCTVAGCDASSLPQREQVAGNCLKESDCSAGQTCKDNQCAACTAHSDCASTVCDTYGDLAGAGKCVAASDLLYIKAVDESDPNCMLGNGTQKLPYCGLDLMLAAGMSPGKPIRLIAGSSTHAIPPIDANAKLTILGAASVVPGQATVVSLGASETPTLSIGTGASLVLDGVILQVNSIAAAAGSKVTIRRSLIQSLVASATFEGSTVTLDRDQFTENLVGLAFKSSTVSITNSFFFRNTLAAGQSLLDLSGGTGVFQLNTVAYNTQGTTVPVLACSGSSAVMVKNSIFAQNGVTQQLGSACRTVPSSLVLGSSDPTAGQIKKDPVFESPQTNDLRLKPRDATNLQFLIDKAVAADASDKNAGHDYFGTPRPQGAAADIGAFEALPQ
jgi:hypothetical protein